MLVPVELIEGKILLIRGQKVMLDRDLAVLYGVETRALNQAVGRNIERFPEDFMLRLTREEIIEQSKKLVAREFNPSMIVLAEDYAVYKEAWKDARDKLE